MSSRMEEMLIENVDDTCLSWYTWRLGIETKYTNVVNWTWHFHDLEESVSREESLLDIFDTFCSFFIQVIYM